MSTPDEIKRYNQWCVQTHGHSMSKNIEGAWVLYEDHTKAIQALEKALAEARGKLDATVTTYKMEVHSLEAEIKTLTEKVEELKKALDSRR